MKEPKSAANLGYTSNFHPEEMATMPFAFIFPSLSTSETHTFPRPFQITALHSGIWHLPQVCHVDFWSHKPISQYWHG